MNNNILYIGYYNDVEITKENRRCVLSAVNKIKYICSALNNIGINIEIVSMSESANKNYYKGKKIQISDQVNLRLFSSVGRLTKVTNVLNCAWMRLKLFCYLLKVKKNQDVIVYHSLGYLKTVAFAKKLKKFKLIVEVEEIYGDVSGSKKIREKEMRFFKNADAYIFPTELLNGKINTKNKPYAIIHGTYNVEPVLTTQFNDGKIHCVYAGTFDPRKGGAAAAAAAGLFLNSNYHIHIIGFGSENDKKMLINTIEDVSKKTECKVTYDGCLSGEAYLKFIQKCHIGLSTQNPNAAFNDTSFPSKILSYMANGLRVVSVRISAIEGSAIGEYMYYYDEQTPENIAQAIMQVDINEDYDSRKIIAELDKQFQEDLQIIL